MLFSRNYVSVREPYVHCPGYHHSSSVKELYKPISDEQTKVQRSLVLLKSLQGLNLFPLVS